MLEAVLGAALDGVALAADAALDGISLLPVFALALTVGGAAACGAGAFFCPDVIALPVFATFDDGLLPAAATEAGLVAGLGVEGTLAF